MHRSSVATVAATVLIAGGCGDVVIYTTSFRQPPSSGGTTADGGGLGGSAGTPETGGTGGGGGAGGIADVGAAQGRVLVEASDITGFWVSPTDLADSDLITVEGQWFDQALQATFPGTPVTEWDAQLIIPLTERVEQDDVIVASFWARCATPPVGMSECTSVFVFEEAADPWTKFAASGFTVGYEWTVHSAAFVVTRAFDPGSAHMLLRLGYEGQGIQFGGFSVIDYGSDVWLDDVDASADAG